VLVGFRNPHVAETAALGGGVRAIHATNSRQCVQLRRNKGSPHEHRR
jgi:hypothetical protein